MRNNNVNINLSEHRYLTAEERQKLFELLCNLDEKTLQELFENSEVYSKLKTFIKRTNKTNNLQNELEYYKTLKKEERLIELQDIFLDYFISKKEGCRCESLVPFATAYMDRMKMGELLPIDIVIDIINIKFFEELACRYFIDNQPATTQIISYKERLLKKIEKLYEQHPYKVIGQPETYCEYNMAWEACIDNVEQLIEESE